MARRLVRELDRLNVRRTTHDAGAMGIRHHVQSAVGKAHGIAAARQQRQVAPIGRVLGQRGANGRAREGLTVPLLEVNVVKVQVAAHSVGEHEAAVSRDALDEKVVVVVMVIVVVVIVVVVVILMLVRVALVGIDVAGGSVASVGFAQVGQVVVVAPHVHVKVAFLAEVVVGLETVKGRGTRVAAATGQAVVQQVLVGRQRAGCVLARGRRALRTRGVERLCNVAVGVVAHVLKVVEALAHRGRQVVKRAVVVVGLRVGMGGGVGLQHVDEKRLRHAVSTKGRVCVCVCVCVC